MTKPCELCGFDGISDPYHPEKGIVQCPDCGLVYFPQVEPIDPASIYSSAYFMGSEYFNYKLSKSALQKTFARRIQVLRKHQPRGKLFEIGSAYGFFLDLARDDWQVRGIDISRDAVRYARERMDLDVDCGDFLKLKDEPESYDLVCMWDTIEHLKHPTAYLQKASRWLKPGGILALTTGDIGSLAARLRGQKWRLIHPPTHLFYFSRETLQGALDRCGLEFAQCTYDGSYRGAKAMLYGLFSSRAKSRRLLNRLLTLGGSKDIPIYLNLFDIMFVVARKPAEGEPGVG